MGQCLSQQNSDSKAVADENLATAARPERSPQTGSIHNKRNPKRSVSSTSNTLQLPIPSSPCPAATHLLIAVTHSQSLDTPSAHRLSEVRMSISASSIAPHIQSSSQPPASPSRPPPSPKQPPPSPLLARRGSSQGSHASNDSQPAAQVSTPVTPSQVSRRVRPPTPKPGDASKPSALRARRGQRRMRSSSLPEIDPEDLRRLQICVSPSHQSITAFSLAAETPSSALHLDEDENANTRSAMGAVDEEPSESNAVSPLTDQTKCENPTATLSAAHGYTRRRSIPNLQIRPLACGVENDMKSIKLPNYRTGRRASEITLASSPKAFSSGTASMRAVNAKTLFGRNISTPPLASIFDEYVNGAERMKYRHVLHLCHDLIDAFIEGYRQRVERELKEKKADITSKNIETQMNIDLPYLLGEGVHKDKTKWVEIAARRMWKLLDFNDEGFVSKAKFMARFMKASEEVLNAKQLKQNNNGNGNGNGSGTGSGGEETLNGTNGPCLVM